MTALTTLSEWLKKPGSKSLASTALIALILLVWDPGPFTLAGLLSSTYWVGKETKTEVEPGPWHLVLWDRVKNLFVPAAVPTGGGLTLDSLGVGEIATYLVQQLLGG